MQVSPCLVIPTNKRCKGHSIFVGQICSQSLLKHPGDTICWGTAIAFACFSCAAIVAEHREYLYLGGMLSSGLSMLWLQFAASIFGHSTSSFMFEVYFGLLIFPGYMVYDTQEIIGRTHCGDMDYIKHALTLFADFVAVLVRILVVMMSFWVA